MPTRRPRFLATILLPLLAAPALAEDWKPSRLWVAGSDESVWVVAAGGVTGQSLPVVQMWYAGKGIVPPGIPRLELPAISGDPLRVAADRESLHVLFSNLIEFDYFPKKPGAAGPLWKNVCTGKPLAWGGDSAGRDFFAVVRTADLIRPATTRPAAEPPGSGPPFTLLELSNGRWLRQDMPDAAREAGAFWLAARNNRLVLVWRGNDGVRSAVRQRTTRWSEPVSVTAARVSCGWAGAAAEGIVFIAGTRAGGDLVNLRLFIEKGGSWTASGEVRDGNELLAIDPDVSGVGLARGKLTVARPTSAGGIEFGQTSLETDPAIRFSALDLQGESPGAKNRLRDWLSLFLLMSVMTTALWSRRAEATRTITLPPALALASVWKRIFATLLDLSPALLITAPWWFPKLAPALREFGPSLTNEQVSELDDQIRVERFAMILAYGLWCYLWEVFTGSTPGKTRMGCRVVSIDAGRPSAKQCFLRNLARVFMFSMGPSGLLVTLMCIVVVTRNRQRIGDLLAHTLVVEDAPVPRDDAPRDDRPFGPFD